MSLKSLSILLVLLLNGCVKHTTFSNVNSYPLNEKNVAIIKNDDNPSIIKGIQYLNRSTGELEEIYYFSESKPGPFHNKFVLQPGVYDIYYSKRSTGEGRTFQAHGLVELKAGHTYRVNYEDCYGLYYKKLCYPGIWFGDLTTGELLSGYKRKIIHMDN